MNESTKQKSELRTVEELYDGAVLLEKEEIASLSFPSEEVLKDSEDIRARARKIHRATSLGNLEKYKVFIVFEDAESIKKINTTIWAQTEKKIVLKGGNSIPVHRIWEVVI